MSAQKTFPNLKVKTCMNRDSPFKFGKSKENSIVKNQKKTVWLQRPRQKIFLRVRDSVPLFTPHAYILH